MTGGRTPRKQYRHGDLRRALLEAGIELARASGPDAVVLREATRQAGVVPNAAYRHFANHQALLQAVRAAALSRLAMAMQKELDGLRPGRDTEKFARASLHAIGTSYLRFALAEPGLFRTAFLIRDEPPGRDETAEAVETGPHPFQLLGLALDRMVDAGLLPKARRPGAEYLAWSAVHGLAMLIIDGPLRRFTKAQAASIGERVVRMVEDGL